MFFKDIARWTKGKLRLAFASFTLLYYGLVLIAPIIIICSKFNIFTKAHNEARLNGLGIIIALVFFIVVYRAVNKLLNKLPDYDSKQQRFKYTTQFILSAAPLIAIAILLFVCKSNLKQVYVCFEWCMWYFVGGKFVDYFFLKYLDKEYELRNKAKEINAVESRRGVV